MTRQPRTCILYLLAISILCCGGCGGTTLTKVPVIPPPDPSAVPDSFESGAIYCPNEYMNWSLLWKGLKGASTQLVVGEPGIIAGQDAIIVRSSSQSSALATVFRDIREELTSEISLVTGRPIKNNADAKEDDERELTDVEFLPEGRGYTLTLSSNTGGGGTWSHVGEPRIHDLHSFLAVIRGWQGKAGTRGVAYMQNGRSLYRIELVIVGAQSLKSSIGKSATIQLRGHATRIFMDGKKLEDGREHDFNIWRSDDMRYLPLRFEVNTRLGMVRGELTDYRQSLEHKCSSI